MNFGNKFLVTTEDFLKAIQSDDFYKIYINNCNDKIINDFLYHFRNQIKREKEEALKNLSIEHEKDIENLKEEITNVIENI